jgi:hypothetical protein
MIKSAAISLPSRSRGPNVSNDNVAWYPVVVGHSLQIPAALRRALNQGYETEANNEKDIESVKTNAPSAPVVDLPEEPAHM